MRKSLQNLVPIVRSDNDIDSILERKDQSISNIFALFIKSDSNIHVMRAIEPNLRFGRFIKNYLDNTKNVPHCDLWQTDDSPKCIRIASRKQIGDALIKYQDKHGTAVQK